MDGCELRLTSPGKPNAHLSFSRGTWPGANPDAGTSWKRVFARSLPQPSQCGSAKGSRKSPEAAPHITCFEGTMSESGPNDFSVTNSAIARRSASFRLAAIRSEEHTSELQ